MISNPAFQHWSLLAERSLLLLWDVTVKSVILIVGVALLTLLLRRASAAQRHLLWLMTLAATLCLPLLSVVVPSHEIRAVSRAVQVKVTPPSAPLPGPIVTLPKALPAPPHTAIVNGQSAPATVETKSPPARISPFPSAQARTVFAFIGGVLSLAVFALWLLGVTLCLGRTTVALLRLNRLRRGLLTLTEPSMTTVTSRIVGEMGMRRPVRFLSASERSALTVPLTWGFWNPIVVLPGDAAKWPEERLRAVLLHELAHIQRGDWAAQMVTSVSCAVYWFNPFVWLASRAMRQECERAADDYALTHGLRPSDYASHLLEIARLVQDRRPPPRQAVAMVRGSKIEARLRTVLAKGQRRQEVTRRLRVTALAIMVCLLLTVSLVRFSSRVQGSPGAGPTHLAEVLLNATVADPSTAPVTLPNGVIVRLVGVADTQTPGPTHWWTANGSPVTERLPKNTLVFPSLPAGLRGSAFAVSTTYDTATQPKFIWATRPNFDWAYAHNSKNPSLYSIKPNFTWEYEPDEHLEALNHFQNQETQETRQGSKTIQMTVNAWSSRVSQKTVTLKYAVAAGPWTESVTCKKTPGKVTIKTASGDVIFTLIPNPHHLPAAQAGRGNARFMVSDHFQTPSPIAAANSLQVALHAGVNYDRDVVGLDSAGRVVMDLRGSMMTNPDGPQEDYRSVKTMQDTSIPNYLLKRIASFRLLARPFQWAEFRGVQLQPHSQAPETAPASGKQAATHRQARGILEEVYLKDVASDNNHSRPFTMTLNTDGHHRFVYGFRNTKTGQNFRDGAHVQADFKHVLAQGWNPRPGAKPYLIPLSLSIAMPTRRVFFTPAQRQQTAELEREKMAWNHLVQDSPLIITDADVEPQSKAHLNNQRPPIAVLDLHLTPEGAKKMLAFTTAAARQNGVIGVIVDGGLLAAPTIRVPFGADSEISDSAWTLADAQLLARRLNSSTISEP